MGFLDDIGKKAVETVQTAKNKTSKISNEMKLKSKLADKEDRIYMLYIEIGKEVYSNFQKGIECNSEIVSSKCKEIVALNEEIDKLKKDVLALKDIKICVSCGAQVSSDSEFCPKCGVKQVTITTDVPKEAMEIKVEVINNEESNNENNI